MLSLQEAKRLAQQNALAGYAGTMDGTGDFSSRAQRRQSIGIGSMFADLLKEGEDEEEEEIRGHEKYQWKYSEYHEAIERENQLLNGDDRASSILSGRLIVAIEGLSIMTGEYFKILLAMIGNHVLCAVTE